MNRIGPSGRVTSSTGNIDREGQIVSGPARPAPFREQPGLDELLLAQISPSRPELAREQLAAVRRLLGLDRACRCHRTSCPECRARARTEATAL